MACRRTARFTPVASQRKHLLQRRKRIDLARPNDGIAGAWFPFRSPATRFAALPQGALFWPARRALLVADLHFEKASWFARARPDAAAL